jgi:hypothetical protein
MCLKHGETVKISYGKSQKPVAMIIPFEDIDTPGKIGLLDGIASFKADGDGKISVEELLGI